MTQTDVRLDFYDGRVGRVTIDTSNGTFPRVIMVDLNCFVLNGQRTYAQVLPTRFSTEEVRWDS